jgi:hypothetical protein
MNRDSFRLKVALAGALLGRLLAKALRGDEPPP